MLPGRAARIVIPSACHRFLEACPITNMECRPTRRRRRKQSEATNSVQREIRRVPAAEPRLLKQFQLLDPPKSQEARIEKRRSCPADLPSPARARAWLNNRRQRRQEHIRQTP